MDIRLHVIKQHNNYIVSREGMPHEFHAHISTYQGCQLLLRCIRDNRMPYSKYLMVSCRRLLTEEEYEQLRGRKKMYYNSNRGVKR